ncbi:MAG: YlmC/YmxH family sporulation protein [Clostridiales bacterium]|nr:YlmC/YmxH family sporulation protein [Clostridiales bacterium]
MERFSVNDIREKEVINVCDGRRLGYIYDVDVDSCSGKILAVVVLFDCRMFGVGKCEELVIPWDKIVCFGEDAVLVNIGPNIYERLKCEGKLKKK